jgi:hypothetical protein
MTTLEKIARLKEAIRLITSAMGDDWYAQRVKETLEQEIANLQRKAVS